MIEKIELCALCGKETLPSKGLCNNPVCLCYMEERERQRRILAELRKSFEAGFCQMLKLGTARPEDAEYYWRDYLAERKA